MTPRRLERFRRLLSERLTELYRSVHGDVRLAMVHEEGDLVEPHDEADEAQRVQQRDLRMSLAETDALRAQLMEEALRRITRGEFGRCVDCDGEIDLPRLEIVPWAARCVACQEELEFTGSDRSPSL